MADYDWFDPCESCGVRQGHDTSCRWHRHYKSFVQGFEWNPAAKAFRCLRGCGTLVWDKQAHMANVCRSWDRATGRE